METKHTPGPWHVEIEENAVTDHVLVTDEQDVSVARCYQQPFDTWRAEANARLIAAAPDLLAALEALTATARTFRNVPKDEQEWGPLDDEAIAAAFAAIARAKGEA